MTPDFAAFIRQEVIFRGMFVKIEYHMRIAGQFPDIL
jgi:hypothetical protein